MSKDTPMTPREAILSQPSFDAAVKTAVAGVKAVKPTYDWVGVYLLEGDPSPGSGQGVLTLRDEHHLGQPTSHTCLPLDSGICGAAAFKEDDRKELEQVARALAGPGK